MHLEPDSLECEVKWALGSITTNKASGSDGIPAELFQILKDDIVQVLPSICQQIWKTQQWPQDWKRSVFIPISKRAMPQNVQTTVQLHSFHMPARLCSKSFKQGFSHTWTKTPDVQARFRKGRGTRDQIDNICWMIERARELKKQKTKNKPSTSASLTMLKPLTVWITTNCGIVLKRWEYLPPEKPVLTTQFHLSYLAILPHFFPS